MSSSPLFSSREADSNHSLTLHGSCGRCHHLFSEVEVNLTQDFDASVDVRCPICDRILVRLGRSLTEDSLVSQETIPPRERESGSTASLVNSINAERSLPSSSSSRQTPPDNMASAAVDPLRDRNRSASLVRSLVPRSRADLATDAPLPTARGLLTVNISDSSGSRRFQTENQSNPERSARSEQVETARQNAHQGRRIRLGPFETKVSIVAKKASNIIKRIRIISSRRTRRITASDMARKSSSSANLVRARRNEGVDSSPPVLQGPAPRVTQGADTETILARTQGRPPFSQTEQLRHNFANVGSRRTASSGPRRDEPRRQRRHELTLQARRRAMLTRSCPCPANNCPCHIVYGHPRLTRRSQTTPVMRLVNSHDLSGGSFRSRDSLSRDLDNLVRFVRGHESPPRPPRSQLSDDSASTTAVGSSEGSATRSGESSSPNRQATANLTPGHPDSRAASRPVTPQLDTRQNGQPDIDHTDEERTPTQQTMARHGDETPPSAPLPETETAVGNRQDDPSDAAATLSGIGQWQRQ